MKQIFRLLTVILLFCGISTKSSGQCSTAQFELDSLLFNPLIEIGYSDTVFSVNFTAGSCPDTLYQIQTNKYGSCLDQNQDSVSLYVVPGSIFLGKIKLSSTTPVSMYCNVVIPANTSIKIIGMSKADSMGAINQTSQIGIRLFVADSTSTYFIPAFGAPELLSQTTTFIGGFVSCIPDPSFSNPFVSPGNNIQIGSFFVQGFGYANHIFWDSLFNLGNVPNSYLTNIHIDTSSTPLGTTSVMTSNTLVTVNQSLPQSPVLCKIFADLSSNISDGDSIKIAMRPFAGFSPTTGAPIYTSKAIGPKMVVDNPPIGPCTMIVSELPTSNTISVGTTFCLGKIQVADSACSITVDSLKLEVFGTAFYGNVGPIYIIRNFTFLANTITSVLSYTQTLYLGDPISGSSDTFAINGTLNIGAMNDIGQTFEFVITVYGHDASGIKITSINLDTKTIVAATNILDTKKDAVTLYPNPTTDVISFVGLKESTEIQISDMSGRIMERKFVSEKDTIDVGNYPKGIYFVKSKDWQQKLIVQ